MVTTQSGSTGTWLSMGKISRFQDPEFNLEVSLSMLESISRTFESNFVIDEYNKFVYTNLLKWIHGDATLECYHPRENRIVPGKLHRGIYIAGGVGVGKSLCLEVLSAYCREKKIPIIQDREMKPLGWSPLSCEEITNSFVSNSNIDHYRNRKILCLQDFGREPLESVSMGNRLSVLRSLLEQRGDDAGVLTLLTSNYPLSSQDIKERYGDRVVSRLSMLNYYEMYGEDRRLEW